MGENCHYCGAKLQGRWERITPGLIRVLIKFKTAVCRNGINEANPNRIPELNHNEKANFQKLRFHGLVAKVKENGEHRQGFWLLTRRGNQFLKNQIRIPRAVFIFRNHIEKYTGEEAAVVEILKDFEMPAFDEKHDFVYEDVGIMSDLFTGTSNRTILPERV